MNRGKNANFMKESRKGKRKFRQIVPNKTLISLKDHGRIVILSEDRKNNAIFDQR